MSPLSASAFKPVILSNDLVEAHLIPYGLHLHRFLVKTSDTTQDLVVGPEDPKLYLSEGRSFRNVLVGRYANRLPVGAQKLAGAQVSPQSNESPQVSLHGGPDGFDLREWAVITRKDSKLFKEDSKFERCDQEALFYLKSEDGDQGFPGTLEIEVLVQLKGKDFTIAYRATQDGAEVTPINLTQHTGWTLNPFNTKVEDISEHEITVHASRYTELDSQTSLATGKIGQVKNAPKPMDLTSSTSLSKFLTQGVDDNLIFDRPRSESDKSVINLSHPRSNVSLSFTSDQSSLMFYTAEHFTESDGTRKKLHDTGKGGYPKHGCLFLEFHAPVGTFLHPDLVQANGGDDTLLKKGETYEAWHTVSVDVSSS